MLVKFTFVLTCFGSLGASCFEFYLSSLASLTNCVFVCQNFSNLVLFVASKLIQIDKLDLPGLAAVASDSSDGNFDWVLSMFVNLLQRSFYRTYSAVHQSFTFKHYSAHLGVDLLCLSFNNSR